MTKVFKKGAMFGLDARIALAIFGALSVISGAALYSAIQEAETTKNIATFNELTKAIEQYMLDTGSYIPETTPTYAILEIGNLFSNYKNVSNWKGPYFGDRSTANNWVAVNYLPNVIYIERRHKADWSGTSLLTSSPTGCSDSDCYMYAKMFGAGSTYTTLENMFNALDKSVDNSDGATKGKVRATSDGTNFTLFYRVFRDYNRMK